ncbi:hypothetical protein Tco_1458890 [Tanacetum coccineum]
MPCSYDRRGMWDRRENVIISLVMKWLVGDHTTRTAEHICEEWSAEGYTQGVKVQRVMYLSIEAVRRRCAGLVCATYPDHEDGWRAVAQTGEGDCVRDIWQDGSVDKLDHKLVKRRLYGRIVDEETRLVIHM